MLVLQELAARSSSPPSDSGTGLAATVAKVQAKIETKRILVGWWPFCGNLYGRAIEECSDGDEGYIEPGFGGALSIFPEALLQGEYPAVSLAHSGGGSPIGLRSRLVSPWPS